MTEAGAPGGAPLPGDVVWWRRRSRSAASRTISRERLVGRAGRADDATLAAVRSWLPDFLGL